MNSKWISWSRAVWIVGACGLPACGSDAPTTPTTPPTQVEIQMQAASFAPATATVATGGTVRWVNALPIAHTVTPNNTSQAGVWATQAVPAQQGFVFSHTFSAAGTFNYLCTIHPGMVGTITVQ